MAAALVMLGMVTLVMIDVPIAVAIGAVGMAGIVLSIGPAALVDVALTMYKSSTSFPLLAVPLFVLAGALMNTGGISQRLVNLVSAMVGFVRGGLAIVNIGVNMFFAEISGSAVADVAAVGSVLIPSMKRRGYSGEFAAAVTSSAGSLAIIIPPSIPMILYAAIADTSVLKLFLSGVVPGVLGGFGLMAVSYYYAVKYNLPREAAFSLQRLWTALREAGWALLLPVIILGGIFGGVVTATEGAGLAVLAALLVSGVIYRDLNLRQLYRAAVDGVLQTATVMLLVAASAVLGLYLTKIQLPQELALAITQMTHEKWLVLLFLNLFLLVIGMFLHSAAAIILVVPIVLPLVQAVGIDLVHFGIIVTLNLAIGQQTPPVASVLATSCSIAKTDMWRTTKVNLPFIAVLLTVLALVTYVPVVALGLVDWAYR